MVSRKFNSTVGTVSRLSEPELCTQKRLLQLQSREVSWCSQVNAVGHGVRLGFALVEQLRERLKSGCVLYNDHHPDPAGRCHRIKSLRAVVHFARILRRDDPIVQQ